MAGSRHNQLWIPIAGASVNQGSDNGAPHSLSPTAYNYSQEHTPYRHHAHSSLPPFTNTFPTAAANEQRGMQSFPSEQSFHGPWQCPHLPHMNTPFAHHSGPNSNSAGPFHSGYNGPRPPMNNFMESSNLSPMPFYPSPREFPGPIPGQATPYDTSLPPVNQNGAFLGRPYLSMNNLPPPMHPYGSQSSFDTYGSTNLDRHRPTAMHNRRQSHQEHHRYSNSFFDASDRRPGIPFGAQGRRSDRSISPRTSAARRNFDRFSQDLGRASTSADADEAAARVPPNQRSRHRPREPRPRFYSQSQPFDPNIPTTRQLQALKDRLQRRLPSELPEETSRMCDICQKDYSETWVNPTEEQEIVIELPCGHCFGEFCIFEWFDTCRTHKNKITCPMCRKQLIEPPRYHPALLNVLSRGGPAMEMLASELRGDFAHV